MLIVWDVFSVSRSDHQLNIWLCLLLLLIFFFFFTSPLSPPQAAKQSVLIDI